MSGIEIIGVVASIVQIADLGGRLSVKLCTFCHKFKNANKALRYLSKDVALTCNVLRQLGDSLGQDDLACLYSPDAFETAQDVLRECEQVFQDLETAIEQHYPDPLSQSRIDKVTRKFKFLMNESHLETVAGNLERLKSTMLLMLNVVIYAGQIRSRRETHELQEQRSLLLVLTSEKIESERNYERLTRTLQFTSLTETVGNMENSTGVDEPDEIKDELYHYCEMVKSVLHDINTVQNILDRDRYHRVRNGFVNLHRVEASALLRVHGQRASNIFRTQIPDSFKHDTSCSPAQEITQIHHNQQSSINLNQSNATNSSILTLNLSELSAQQIRERVMQIARELQTSRQAPQASGQHDPLHQQRQMQTLRLLQARAMYLQQQQAQSQMQSPPAMQAPPLPQQKMQARPAPPMSQLPQMRRQIQQQQMQRQQIQTRPAPPMPQMHRSSANHNNINQLSNQSHELYRPAPPLSFMSGQPDPPPQYTPPMRSRSRSRAPTYNVASQAQSSPPTPPFPITQSSESDIKQRSPGPSVPDENTFSLDFSALDNPDIMESFDFDSFLNQDEDQAGFVFDKEQSKSDQVSIEVVSSQTENKDPQPDQPLPLGSGDSTPKRKRKKRNANATFSADDNSKSRLNSDTRPEEGQSKRVQLDPSTSLPPTLSAGTETQNLPSAATEDQSSTSKDTPIETLDSWILRWTKLELTELK